MPWPIYSHGPRCPLRCLVRHVHIPETRSFYSTSLLCCNRSQANNLACSRCCSCSALAPPRIARHEWVDMFLYLSYSVCIRHLRGFFRFAWELYFCSGYRVTWVRCFIQTLSCGTVLYFCAPALLATIWTSYPVRSFERLWHSAPILRDMT